MTYEYKCEEHGVIEITHGMMESRDGRLCPTCEATLKPLISGGAQVLLTGRPPWAYNDVTKAARASEDGNNTFVDGKTTVTDKRDNSKFKGQKHKLNNSMGCYNAQW